MPDLGAVICHLCSQPRCHQDSSCCCRLAWAPEARAFEDSCRSRGVAGSPPQWSPHSMSLATGQGGAVAPVFGTCPSLAVPRCALVWGEEAAGRCPRGITLAEGPRVESIYGRWGFTLSDRQVTRASSQGPGAAVFVTGAGWSSARRALLVSQHAGCGDAHRGPALSAVLSV